MLHTVTVDVPHTLQQGRTSVLTPALLLGDICSPGLLPFPRQDRPAHACGALVQASKEEARPGLSTTHGPT